ncbi:CRN-like protein [Plasmopara halstedii]|uniref:CRN-like protein n=1 Tax=Plasmopara halstedii TaxID=4781 RepID=A0A0P1B3S9_PLAHL|nr:CRN-like protein [Plasmopara halstedii]CEG48896.1 CRN-like protein [Plasmopara halstedii]|eukprot:XP_024585265.1 CRN-like protein [Plasmopara halstedii]
MFFKLPAKCNEVVDLCGRWRRERLRGDINDSQKVWELKKIIKDAKMYSFPSDQLTLYVAKKSGSWLKTDDPDVTMLENDDVPIGIINKKENKMDPSYRVRNTVFGLPNEDAAADGEKPRASESTRSYG